MPQMMPMNWVLMFLFFVMIFILFNIMNYFSVYKLPTTKSSVKTLTKTLSWKW
uniref:ATP synthase complex subunit 8 n=1 Tax=Eomantis yunnanensis TaxID=2073090 RepID=A0A343UNC7_9NEOP|nr:ATP synthase F0 subunit 8 [Eomantis yunnanensis]AVE15777.1 ATP synthase F0 subunit 8 [Eomantis yunnanensis]